jgi:hypothetical protein
MVMRLAGAATDPILQPASTPSALHYPENPS